MCEYLYLLKLTVYKFIGMQNTYMWVIFVRWYTNIFYNMICVCVFDGTVWVSHKLPSSYFRFNQSAHLEETEFLLHIRIFLSAPLLMWFYMRAVQDERNMNRTRNVWSTYAQISLLLCSFLPCYEYFHGKSVSFLRSRNYLRFFYFLTIQFPYFETNTTPFTTL